VNFRENGVRLFNKQMEKSYAKLLRRTGQVTQVNAVAAAVENLRRHSCGNVLCSRSQCGNDEASRFEVTDIDSVTRSITEVKCKKCKFTSYVCHFQCYCQRTTPNGLECSYKEQLQNRTVQHNRKSIHICSVIDSTIAILRRNNSGNTICSCGNDDLHQLKVIGVDRLGFITSIECSVCQQELGFSPLEASYVVQMLYHEKLDLYHGRSNDEAVLQKVLSGDYVEHRRELCTLIRRHSFYENSICPEFDTTSMRNDEVHNDEDCCRVTAIASGTATEVEFDLVNESPQRLRITCGSGCYYRQYSSPTEYEKTYKAEMRAHLARETDRRQATSEIRLKEAILSCTVLAANATILRRHNIDNKLCLKCKNDDHNLLNVIKTDKYGFITRVQCIKCGQSMSTACHHSRFYYEEIDESMTLERGDHIAWHRNLAYWHHAVVTDTDDNRITIAHYASNGCSVTFHQSTKNRRDLSTSVRYGSPYRVTHDDCYTNEYSALRSEQRVVYRGDKGYHPFSRNCEHSSNWCKTGLSKSDQVKTCFSSVVKSVLAFGLRVLNMLLLVAFQVVHEKREGIQIDRKAFEMFEHIITGAYMLLVFLLFLVWSMYTECIKLKPTSAGKCCCERPPGVACGLLIRIFVRELFAALGPFLFIWFEDRILPQEAVSWIKTATIIPTLIGVTLVSYGLGAVIGTLLEYTIKRCRSISSVQREQIDDHLQEEIQPDEGSQQTLVIQ